MEERTLIEEQTFTEEPLFMEEETFEEEEPKKKTKKINLSGNTLKIIASVLLLVYSFSRIVIQNGMMHIGQYSSDELTELVKNDSHMAALTNWGAVLQLIGNLAIPIFAFLLVEGFLHTKSYRRYLLSMLVLAVISEVPYDWAINEKLLDFSSQNIIFSSVIALLLLYALSRFDGQKGIMPRTAQLLMVVAAVLWSIFGRCSFGFGTVLLAAAYYLFRKNNFGRLLIGCALSMIYYSAPLSSLLLWCYHGERGGKGKKYVFYALYPLQLIIFGAVAHLM